MYAHQHQIFYLFMNWEVDSGNACKIKSRIPTNRNPAKCWCHAMPRLAEYVATSVARRQARQTLIGLSVGGSSFGG